MFGELLMILKDNNEGMQLQLDAAVPEKLLYIFLA